MIVSEVKKFRNPLGGIAGAWLALATLTPSPVKKPLRTSISQRRVFLPFSPLLIFERGSCATTSERSQERGGGEKVCWPSLPCLMMMKATGWVSFAALRRAALVELQCSSRLVNFFLRTYTFLLPSFSVPVVVAPTLAPASSLPLLSSILAWGQSGKMRFDFSICRKEEVPFLFSCHSSSSSSSFKHCETMEKLN